MIGKGTSGGGNLGEAQAMQQGDRQIATGGQKLQRVSGAKTRAVFLEGDIADIMGSAFTGIITNDKFCMRRMKPFQISHDRKLEVHEVQDPTSPNGGDCLVEEAT